MPNVCIVQVLYLPWQGPVQHEHAGDHGICVLHASGCSSLLTPDNSQSADSAKSLLAGILKAFVGLSASIFTTLYTGLFAPHAIR